MIVSPDLSKTQNLTDLLFASDTTRVAFSCSTSMSGCPTVPRADRPGIPAAWLWGTRVAAVPEAEGMAMNLEIYLRFKIRPSK